MSLACWFRRMAVLTRWSAGLALIGACRFLSAGAGTSCTQCARARSETPLGIVAVVAVIVVVAVSVLIDDM